jgi:hypothetical protein
MAVTIIFLAIRFSMRYVRTEEGALDVGPTWYHHLLLWDSEWYLRIATTGYQYDGDDLVPQTVIFFHYIR